MERKLYMLSMFIVTVIFMMACDKVPPSANISNNVLITVLNEKGEDLLDPSHPSTINLNRIKVYYELNGVMTEINRPNLDFPQMYRLQEPILDPDSFYYSEHYRIYLSLNTEDNSNPTTTYFEWNPEDIDVFESTLIRSRGSIHNDKIRLNGELMCDRGGDCEVTKVME